MSKVQCYVYDISQGMARVLSTSLVGKQVDIIPHTGIVVGGVEYFFGGGICTGTPGNCIPMKPCEIVELGTTSKTAADIQQWIRDNNSNWTQEGYDLLERNCNHFSNALAQFLGCTEVPGRIVNIAQEALSTPQGQQLKVMIEGMEAGIRGQTQGNLNPFGNVGSSTSAAPTSTPVSNLKSDEDNEIPSLDPSLKDITAQTDDMRRDCLKTVHTLAKNALNNPHEDKFKRIKMENPAFMKKVGECPGGTEAMTALGFVPDTVDGTDFWVIQPAAYRTLKDKVAQLGRELDKCPGAKPAPAPAATRAADPASPFPGLNSGGAPPMGGMGGMPGGLPGGLPAGLMNNPQMMAQAQAMMQNPQMMAQAQAMMQNPQMMAQAQAMMNDPNMMAQLQNMMNNGQGPR